MKYYILSIIYIFIGITLTIVSCESTIQSENCKYKKDCVPYLIYELKSDTIVQGQALKGYFSFSDTSWLYVYKGTDMHRIVPIFKIDGQRIYDRTDTAHFSILVNSENPTNGMEEKMLLLELTVPNPKGGEITFTERVFYIVKVPDL